MYERDEPSRLRPLVSGTSRMVNSTLRRDQAAKKTKVPTADLSMKGGTTSPMICKGRKESTTGSSCAQRKARTEETSHSRSC